MSEQELEKLSSDLYESQIAEQTEQQILEGWTGWLTRRTNTNMSDEFNSAYFKLAMSGYMKDIHTKLNQKK